MKLAVKVLKVIFGWILLIGTMYQANVVGKYVGENTAKLILDAKSK